MGQSPTSMVVTPLTPLLVYAIQADRTLATLTGDERLRTFMVLRYDDLGRRFPHAVFSVGEATLDFFERTTRYLLREEDLPKPQSEYERHYVDWLRSHMS